MNIFFLKKWLHCKVFIYNHTPSNSLRRDRTMHLKLSFNFANKLQKTTLVLFKLVELLFYLSFSYY